MKKTLTHFLLFCCFVFSFFISFSQTTIVLQPDETNSKDATIWNIFPVLNEGNDPSFIATAWTNSGSPDTARALIEFDLTSIPPFASIQSAVLSLYHFNSTSNIGHSTLSGSNDCWLRKIISPWNEMIVNWNNQPATTTQSQVYIPESINDSVDYPYIDVITLISDAYNNPATNYGMMLMLVTEQYYRSMLFSSSNNADTNKRPKLTVTYTLLPTYDTCIVIRPNNDKSEDAMVWDFTPNTNHGNFTDFTANAWTNSGTPTVARSLINFELPLPAFATITSATLKLYHYNSTNTIGHSTMDGPNDCWLRRIISPWNDNTVTWTNQPTTTTQNQVHIPASTNDTMNYPNIDVTNLISDIYNNPSTSYGMMIMLQTEQYYRSLLFGSSDCPDQNKIPLLEVCYHINASVPEIKTLDSYSLSVYPNPAQDNISIDYNLADNSNVTIDFYNITGKLIDRINTGIQTNGKHSLNYDLNKDLFPAGVYYIRLSNNKTISTIKFVKIS